MKNKTLVFHTYLHSLEDFEYLLYFLKVQCAPTRVGLKVGTMLNLTHTTRPLSKIWEKYEKELKRQLGLEAFCLKETDTSTLLLFYKKDVLANYLNQKEVRAFLKDFGYDHCNKFEDYLYLLKSHFKGHCPNEVGVFLGYPLEDVRSFHCKGGRACLASGYWKCYHNVEESLHKFRLFDLSRKHAIDIIMRKKKIG
ncbi:MAG: DUF3793 family protein [Tissierellia bacterium]|nr:DUF3793 family protein [Tissierellia bacterium]